MKITIPLTLRRFLLTHFLVAVTLASAATAAEFVVDASQTTNKDRNVYATLQELAVSGTLSSGDTVILHNDDATLETSLPAAVNFRSNDSGTFRTINLSGLGLDKQLYAPAKQQGNVILEMDSIIWSNFSRPLITDELEASSIKITGRVQFTQCDDGYYVVEVSTPTTFGDGVVFHNNTRVSDVAGKSAGNGGLIMNIDNHLTMGNGAIFSGNVIISTSEYDLYAGVIYNSGGSVTIGDNATFFDNSSRIASYRGSHIYGGSIYSYGGTVTLGSNAVFARNQVINSSQDAFGGAITSAGSDLIFQDGATFMNNYATTSGGAIHVSSSAALSLHALTKDVLFSGNMTGGVFDGNAFSLDTLRNGIANAIHINDGNTVLTLAAAQGREIRFNDPITSDILPDARETFTLNRYTDEEGKVHDTNGTIIFSGELYQGDEAHLAASRYSNFVADTTLYGGVLLLSGNAVFGRNLEDMRQLSNNSSSLTVRQGTLEITGGSTANATSFSL
ncbi:hypothetical protein, partial [uncultured Akkermansia sp.]|uniref:hypothetical protein n=2 Tax=uncultured Akkermansia sp. TaxID=512294 RepID=UPI0026389D74